MLHYSKLLIVTPLVMLFTFCTACASPTKTQPEQITSVVLDSSQIFTIYSPTNKQNYRIQARLPGSYQNNPSKKYPVIIKVDGQWDFPLAASVFNNIYFDGQMPETIIIGIDWADVKGNVHAIRARDLLPAPMGSFANSGHAKKFVEVLEKEIIPELNNRFRLNGQEFLLGGSWGGTFVTFALLEQPNIFDGAIAIAGDYKTASEVFDKQIKSLSGSNALDGKRLYIGVGNGDPVAPAVLDYAEKLKQAKLNGFKLKLDHLEGFGHSGMNVPGYAAGYQHVFERPRLSLATDKLRQFVGKYKSADANAAELTIQTEPQGLTAAMDGNPISLLAKSENSFYHPGMFVNITFEATQAKVETFFGETIYQRVDVKSQK
jgi:predicted alpha/beta superfamily hydrolase